MKGSPSCTVREYRRIVTKTIKPAMGGMRTDRITGRHPDAFYGRLGR